MIFRRDRHSLSDPPRKGGGVLIALSSRFTCTQLSLAMPHQEQLAVLISHPIKLIVTSSYIPPSSRPEIYMTHISNIRHLSERYHNIPICVFGDFNLPDTLWHCDSDPLSATHFSTQSSSSHNICSELVGLGLIQYNQTHNSLGKQLDLIFLSNDLYGHCSPSLQELVPIDPLHPPLEFQISLPFSSQYPSSDSSSSFLNFRKTDFLAMDLFFNSLDWESIIAQHSDISSAYSAFIDKIHTAIDLFVPVTSVGHKPNPPWFNNSYSRLLKAKARAHKRFKRTSSVQDRDLFTRLRRESSVLGKYLYKQYHASLEFHMRSDPKRFWKVVRAKRSTPTDHHLVTYLDQSASTASESADLFASFFNSVYEPPLPNVAPFPNGPSSSSIPIPQIPLLDVSSIKDAVSSIKLSVCPGPDGIPSILVKSCPSLILPITILTNRSFSEGKFFNSAKMATIIPIHKNGSKSAAENYRAIASQSVIPKLVENLMSNHIMFHASSKINHFQHGFVPRRSTTTNLASFCHHALSALENGSQLDVLYVDFSKAFDKVDHLLLLSKLRNLGLADLIIDWLSSFISSWSYRVLVKGKLSKPFFPSSGVPQGTHLGPILFILFTLDMPSALHFCSALSFADDTKLFARISSNADCIAFQSDINAFCNWCLINGMHLNLSKTHIMSISRRSSTIHWNYTLGLNPVTRTTSVKDLGVTYDCSLDFSPHIYDICARSFRLIGFLKRNRCLFSQQETLLHLYITLVRPLLEYASSIWSPFTSSMISMIESIQRNITRFIVNSFHVPSSSSFPSYPERCSLLSVDSLLSRRITSDALFIRGLLLNLIDAPLLKSLLVPRPTDLPIRLHRPLYEDLHRSRFAQNTPLPRCIHTFNLLFADPTAPNPETCSRSSYISYCRERSHVVVESLTN